METSVPWHYTTIIDLLDHWQAFLAGVLGFIAAIGVVWFTLRSERRKVNRELDALRRSLGVELRQCVVSAVGVHGVYKDLAQRRGTPITARTIEYLWHLPSPVIYPACAEKIGLLGLQAMEVVTIYNLIEVVRAKVTQLVRHRMPDDIPPILVASVAHALMIVCETARGVLPKLKTNVAEIDNRDRVLIERITNAASAWSVARQEWPQLDTYFGD